MKTKYVFSIFRVCSTRKIQKIFCVSPLVGIWAQIWTFTVFSLKYFFHKNVYSVLNLIWDFKYIFKKNLTRVLLVNSYILLDNATMTKKNLTKLFKLNFLANEIRFQKIKYGFRIIWLWATTWKKTKLNGLLDGTAMVAHYSNFPINKDLKNFSDSEYFIRQLIAN